MNNETMLTNVEARQNVYLKKVYLWMALGLGVTALTAFLTAASPSIVKFIYSNPFVTILCFVLELAFVFILSGRLEKLSVGACFGLFFGYSFVTGVTFSSILLVYAGTNVITLSFVTASAVFGVAAIYGSVTKKSIKGWGGWIMMGLISLIVVSLVNIFIGSSRLEMLISGVGVILFAFLTAWDSQKLMDMNRNCGPYMTQDELSKLSIMGALDLYLDFINIFLYLVRLFGSAKDN
ncbi:MAG: Bax inhibitor-1 family protein [Candidatus Ornithospirochaeta sp.]